MPESGDEAGENERRLAAAARPDDGDESLFPEPLDQLPAHRLPPEEVDGVRFAERAEALVRVAHRRRCGLRDRSVRRHPRRLEGRLLAQHHARELAQGRRRLDPELFPEDLARLVVDLERLCLSPGSVEREHQVRPELLAPRVLAHQLFQLADELSVQAEQEDAALGTAPRAPEPARPVGESFTRDAESILFAFDPLNHNVPSGPEAMPDSRLPGVGLGNSSLRPAIEIRPILLPAYSVNQSAPSGPETMPFGLLATVRIPN